MRVLKHLSIVGLLAAVVVGSTARAGEKTIVDIAAGDENFSTLVTALTAADLVDQVKTPAGLTVFAPTNAAFAKLPAGTVESLLKPENKAKLVAVLTDHMVPGRVMSSDIAGKKLTVPTAQGRTVSVDATSGVMVNDAKVVKADIVASNGVIHVVDTVLIPQ